MIFEEFEFASAYRCVGARVNPFHLDVIIADGIIQAQSSTLIMIYLH